MPGLMALPTLANCDLAGSFAVESTLIVNLIVKSALLQAWQIWIQLLNPLVLVGHLPERHLQSRFRSMDRQRWQYRLLEQ